MGSHVPWRPGDFESWVHFALPVLKARLLKSMSPFSPGWCYGCHGFRQPCRPWWWQRPSITHSSGLVTQARLLLPCVLVALSFVSDRHGCCNPFTPESSDPGAAWIAATVQAAHNHLGITSSQLPDLCSTWAGLCLRRHGCCYLIRPKNPEPM